MAPFLALALSFPAVVYTVLLGVALVYWVFVMVGAAHVNLLGDGAMDAAVDGAVDAAIDGVAKGALEGATKGMLEGAADHLEGAGGHGHDADVGDVGGGNAGIIAALKLRSAPATVVMSALLLFSWVFTILGMKAVLAVLPGEGIVTTLAKAALLVVAPMLALFPTSVVVRPLARVFTPIKATTHNALVGKMCTIRTGTVTDRFGEATLEDGGAGVVVRVRVESGEKLARGDQAVIVGYDATRQEFTVAPLDVLDDVLDDEEPRRRRAR
ncbi:MAG: glycine zipper family protein [Labilithrix sp.]|nr:glycine zipper family protein [Labilithrix sp.]